MSSKLLSQVQKVMPAYFRLLKKVDVVYLFGSAARGIERNKSDIDLGILLHKNLSREQAFDLRLKVMQDLSDLFKKDVDVVILNDAGLVLQHQVLRYGKMVYTRDNGERLHYEVTLRNEYFDFKPIIDRYTSCFVRDLKGVGLDGRYRGDRDTLEDARRICERFGAI